MPLLDGQKKILANCSAWDLLNLPIELVANLPALVKAQTGIDEIQTASFMAPFTVSALGMAGACQEYIFSRGLKNLPCPDDARDEALFVAESGCPPRARNQPAMGCAR